jgi:hypothetical protein
VVVGLTMTLVMRALGHVPRLDRVTRTVAATAGMTLAVWVARELGAEIVVLLLVGGVVYGALVVLLGALTLDDLRALAARRAPD